jgi:hypothetical protein
MKARIPDNKYNSDPFKFLDKILGDKRLAEKFYNYLTERYPDREIESFDKWYSRLTTADFLKKIRNMSEPRPNRETRRTAKKKGGD